MQLAMKTSVLMPKRHNLIWTSTPLSFLLLQKVLCCRRVPRTSTSWTTLILKSLRMTPRLVCLNDLQYPWKFVLLLSGSARCFGLCFFFNSSSYKYNCLVQDCGRVLYTVSFSQLKGFLDVGRPPFFEFHEKMNTFIFIFHCVWTYTFPVLCMKFLFS